MGETRLAACKLCLLFIAATIWPSVRKSAASWIEWPEKQCSSNNSRLEWFEKLYVDDTQTFSLRICCDVTHLWLGMVHNDWEVKAVPALQWVSTEALSMPGFDLILSKCAPDGRVILGQVIDRRCRLLRGNIATFSKGFDAHQLPRFDAWYVTCLRMVERQPMTKTSSSSSSSSSLSSSIAPSSALSSLSSSASLSSFSSSSSSSFPSSYPSVPKNACLVCRLDMYCSGGQAARCRDQFLYRELLDSSFDRVRLTVRVGDLPFGDDQNGQNVGVEIRTQVYDSAAYSKLLRSAESHADSRSRSDSVSVSVTDSAATTTTTTTVAGVHYENTASAGRNRTLTYEIDGLAPNRWYMIRTCLLVRTPRTFYDRYKGMPLPAAHEFCLLDEGHRTQRKPAPKRPLAAGALGVEFFAARLFGAELFGTSAIVGLATLVAQSLHSI